MTFVEENKQHDDLMRGNREIEIVSIVHVIVW